MECPRNFFEQRDYRRCGLCGLRGERLIQCSECGMKLDAACLEAHRG